MTEPTVILSIKESDKILPELTPIEFFRGLCPDERFIILEMARQSMEYGVCYVDNVLAEIDTSSEVMDALSYKLEDYLW